MVNPIFYYTVSFVVVFCALTYSTNIGKQFVTGKIVLI